MTAPKSVHLCIFMVELGVSIVISSTSYWVLKFILPYNDATVATAVSTLLALWIVHVTIRAIQLLLNASNEDGLFKEKGAELNDPIHEFQSRMNRDESIRSCQTMYDDANFSVDPPEQPECTSDAKNLLLQAEIESSQSITRISASILATFTTVVLQCSFRLFTLLHSINRTFRTKRQSARRNNPLVSFLDIPFTIGKNMSLGGRSFFIFYFLDRWFDQSADDLTGEGSVMLQTISFDQISINSAQALVQKFGRFGFSLGGVEFRLTVHLKQNKKHSPSKAAQKASVSSITVAFRVESLDFGIFPSVHMLQARGLQFDANVAFTSAGSMSSSTSLAGVGMRHECDGIIIQGFCCKGNKILIGSLLKSNADQKSVISWDTIRSTAYLHEMRRDPPQPDARASTKKVVSLISIPSGNAVVSSLLHRQAAVFVGKGANTNLAVGLDLVTMPTFILAINWLLGDIASSLCSSVKSNGGEIQSDGNKKARRSSSIEVVALDASFCSCLYLPLQGNGAFYLSSPNTSGYWRKSTQISAKEICPSDKGVTSFNSALHAVSLRGVKFQHCQSDVRCLDAICLKGMKANLFHIPESSTNTSDSPKKHATADVGDLVVRIDDMIIKQFADMNNSTRQVTAAANDLKIVANQFKKRLHSTKERHNLSTNPTKEAKRADTFEISSSCVDAVIELRPPNEDAASSDDKRLRIASFQKKANTRIFYRTQTEKNIRCDEYGAEKKLPLPNSLFEAELQRHDYVCVIEANIEQLEASVTFHPHATLPTINDLMIKKETTYYIQTKQLQLKVASPPQSQIICAVADEVRAYEVIGNQNKPSLFSIPVHDVHNLNDKNDTSSWPMLQSCESNYKVGEMAVILDGRGKFCRVERNDRLRSEKLEIMSIQLCRGTSSAQIYWSPVFQWLQTSCNDRIQSGIEYIKTSLAGSTQNQSGYNCRKTQIRFRVDSNATARFHTALGKKTVMHTLTENGIDVNMSMAKHRSASSAVMVGMKPNIRIDAGRVLASFNDINAPTFVFGGISFKNFTRRATSQEVAEYVHKKGGHCDDLDYEIVTDWEGHPMKEIFDLSLDSCTAKFHPKLFFGEVIDDFLLTPRAIDAGVDSLKTSTAKRAKKYQLMSIQVAFSFLDISLLDDVSCAGSKARFDLVLQDIARIYCESIHVEIERDTPPSITQPQITALDEDTTSTYAYGPSVQGGQIRRLTIDHAVATLIPLNLHIPLLRIDSFDMTGYLFLTGICPETSGIIKGRTSNDLLLCHHSLSSNRSEKLHCGCCYGIQSNSNGIPTKVYTDCKVRCIELDVNYGPVMNLSIQPLMECIQRLLPPPQHSPDDTPLPLTWWDNVRFFIHGNIGIFADALSIRWLLDSQYLSDKSILLTCQCSIDYKLGFFGIDATDLNVSLPGVPYDMSVHPSNRSRSSNDYTLPHEADTAEEERHPVIHVPFLSTKINFAWKMLDEASDRSTRHHTPYIKDGNLPDKFASFRSNGISNAKIQFDLPGADKVQGNWVLLRIDVFPWLTHVNSTVTPPSTSDTEKSESFPQFQALDINVNITQLQIATWFAGEKELDGWDDYDAKGACIIVTSLKYTASGGDKDLIIEGPVKGALLDISELIESLERHEADDDAMRKVEKACQNFGRDPGAEMNSVYLDEMSIGNDSFDTSPFFKLQELLGTIKELDYVVIAGQIDIQNKSLQHILGSRTSFGSEEFAGVNQSTWSILVSQLKILWTLDIRDNLMALTQDLLFTTGFMKAQLRQSQLFVEGEATSASTEDNSQSTPLQKPTEEEGIEVTLSSTNEVEGTSRLEYLLRRNSSFDLDVDGAVSSEPYEHKESDDESNPSLPTIDIHFSNPQVQLHRKTTGGSIILAMEGARVEGRKFVRFLVDSHKVVGKVSPADLTRRTEHFYTLTNMQAYSLNTRVDVTAGLPWLEVCTPGSKVTVDCQPETTERSYLEERFGIAANKSGTDNAGSSTREESPTASEPHQCIYPPHLRHHEPLAFVKSGFCSPILTKFTFKSRQSFHRPPIHYSKDELLAFIDRGLVSKQYDEIVDEVDLTIDLLHFTLDSYQMKQTFDIIRNVLLEPPKPSRHRNFDEEENKPQTPSNRVRVSSVAAMEMEEVLSSDCIYRGKHGREKLRAAATALLRDLEDRHALAGDIITRRVSYTLKKLRWRIHSPDSIDNVEIAFTGFVGQHDYSFDGSVSTQFSLEDVRVSSTKPGPDAICFPDPTSIMKPVLDERSPCLRCNNPFDHDANDLHSCLFHDGKYRSDAWSCCGSTYKHSLGCKRGPHTGKERAALVRIEALPRIVEGITLYSHFEVIIFPEIPHTTTVQISKSLSKLFMNYFFVDDGEVEVSGKAASSDVPASADSISYQSDSTSRQKSLLIGGKGSPRERSHTEDDVSESLAEVSAQTELVLIKVWRVGYINVELSVAGFRRIPQRTVDIRVHDYSKAYKIGSWGYLGKKYLTYLIHETLKSGASSAIFRRKATGNAAADNNDSTMPKQSTSFEADHESFLRHFRARPTGAETFLGTAPARQPKAKGKHVKKVANKSK